MHNQELSRQLQQLNSLFDRTKEACGDNFELRSDWAKYLCVLTAGMIENSIKLIYSDYAQRNVSQPVANFVESSLSHILNPKAKKFYDIALAFKESWKTELQNYADLAERAEAIDSIMVNRHLIAHGKSRDSHVTVTQIRSYLDRSVEFIEFIENQCLQ